MLLRVIQGVKQKDLLSPVKFDIIMDQVLQPLHKERDATFNTRPSEPWLLGHGLLRRRSGVSRRIAGGDHSAPDRPHNSLP